MNMIILLICIMQCTSFVHNHIQLRNVKTSLFSVTASAEELQLKLNKVEEELKKQLEFREEIETYFITGKVDKRKKVASLKELCEITHEACEILQPMIQIFYMKCSESYGTAKLKSDATFFSIADGVVQHLLVEHLFAGNKFGQIVGEEDETNVNIVTKPYTVDDLMIPPEFDELVESTRNKIQNLAKRIDPNSYKGITIFVDPIDGTREFATGKGEFCSILVGYNNLLGKPVAGIIYRPLTNPPTWAAGAKSENCVMGNLDKPAVPNLKGVLVSDGVNTPFLERSITELGYEKIPCYASGNRALMLVEGKAGAYIRDTGGFAKWDCSGPQAVLEAYGGAMAKMPKFLVDKSLESYTYLKSKVNLDFEPEETLFTLSNAKDKRVARMVRDVLVPEVELVKEYACLQGLLALEKSNFEKLDVFYDALNRAKEAVKPMYT